MRSKAATQGHSAQGRTRLIVNRCDEATSSSAPPRAVHPPRQRLRPFSTPLRPRWPVTPLREKMAEHFARVPQTGREACERSARLRRSHTSRSATGRTRRRPHQFRVGAREARPQPRTHRTRAACRPRGHRHPARSRCLLCTSQWPPAPTQLISVPPKLALDTAAQSAPTSRNPAHPPPLRKAGATRLDSLTLCNANTHRERESSRHSGEPDRSATVQKQSL